MPAVMMSSVEPWSSSQKKLTPSVPSLCAQRPEGRQPQDGVPPHSSVWAYLADVDVTLRGVLERRVGTT